MTPTVTDIVRDEESITRLEIEELRDMLGEQHQDWRGVAIIRALMVQVRLMRSILERRQ